MTIDLRISRARNRLINHHPFFGALSMQLHAVERRDIPATATDGKSLFYNPQYLDTLTEPLQISTVAHLVLHCALQHHVRGVGKRKDLWDLACDYVVNQMLIDADFQLHPDWVHPLGIMKGMNAEQIYRTMTAPPEALKQKKDEDNEEREDDEAGEGQDKGDQPEDQRSGTGSGGRRPRSKDDGNSSGKEGNANKEGGASSDNGGTGTAEGGESEGNETHAPGGSSPDGGNGGRSKSDGPPSEQAASETSGSGGRSTPAPSGSPNSSNEEGVGTGTGVHNRTSAPGQVLDAAPAEDLAALSEAGEEWQVYTRQAVNVARRATAEGRLPAFIEEVVKELEPPEADWRTVLRRFVDPSSTKDYSWSTPNRRYSPFGMYTPGTISDGISHVAIAVDTSGSIDTKALSLFGGEAQLLLDEGAVDKITLLFVDTQVHRSEEYVKGDQIDFMVKGRGGTRFAPTFDWLSKNTTDVVAVVYFTDLDCTDWGETDLPVLWAVYGHWFDRSSANLKAPFGECMLLR